MTVYYGEFKPQPRFAPLRPLPIALAHELARTKLGNQHRQGVLGRIFRGMTPADKLRCMDELGWCRLAKRGEVKAQIVAP